MLTAAVNSAIFEFFYCISILLLFIFTLRDVFLVKKGLSQILVLCICTWIQKTNMYDQIYFLLYLIHLLISLYCSPSKKVFLSFDLQINGLTILCSKFKLLKSIFVIHFMNERCFCGETVKIKSINRRNYLGKSSIYMMLLFDK